MITGDDRWFQVATALLNAVRAALTVPLVRGGVVAGAIAWDGGDCGALYVSWTHQFYSDDFPHALVQPLGNCAPALEVAEFTLQVVRCSPSADTSRNPVGFDVLSTAAQQLAVDAQQMMSAVLAQLCAMQLNQQIEDYMMGSVMPVGPEGGLVAVEVNAAVALIR